MFHDSYKEWDCGCWGILAIGAVHSCEEHIEFWELVHREALKRDKEIIDRSIRIATALADNHSKRVLDILKGDNHDSIL